jgi:hypothetical protein
LQQADPQSGKQKGELSLLPDEENDHGQPNSSDDAANSERIARGAEAAFDTVRFWREAVDIASRAGPIRNRLMTPPARIFLTR